MTIGTEINFRIKCLLNLKKKKLHVLRLYSFFYFEGVGTTLDPALFRADKMVGQVLGAVGSLPDIYTELTISVLLLRRLLGVRPQNEKRGPKVSMTRVSTTTTKHDTCFCHREARHMFLSQR